MQIPSRRHVMTLSANQTEEIMNQRITLGLAMLASAAFGAAAVNGLHAQGKGPGAYVIVDISAINNPDLYKTLIPKAGPAMEAFGGKFIVRTEKVVAFDGPPTNRFVIVAFDSLDKAKAWHDSAATKEVDDIRMKSSTSRAFAVEPLSN
jgi:uncharacterized protein (DUF1330 family)